MRVLTRMWQMLLKALDEVASAPNAMMAAEMAVIRLTHVADLPPPEELVRKLQGDESKILFGLLLNDKPVVIDLFFENQEARQTNIATKWREGDFKVWAAMLGTCRREIGR